MKHLIKFLPALLFPLGALANPVNYTVDPNHSYAYFSVTHLGMTTIQGRFDQTAGKVTVDLAAKTGAMEIQVPTASASTGLRSRDDMLKGPDWFNSNEFANMVYRSSRFAFAGDKLESIEGTLTLAGVTKPLKLNVTTFRCGAHPFNRKPMCGATAEATLKRSDFGVKAAMGAVSDEVRLQLSVEVIAE